MISECILGKLVGKVWTGWMWLKIGASGEFHKKRGIPSLPELLKKISAPQSYTMRCESNLHQKQINAGTEE
jgi:hypothetical protein